LGWWGDNFDSILLISPVADLSDPASLLLRIQECRFATPWDTGITVLSMGDGILICPLGLQTQQ
jgi:hypothetical protein